MSTRAKAASILVGLTTLGAVFGSGLEAEGSSITITGQQRPGSGDPPYEYIFDVTLQANSFIQSGDFFTIESLIGITPANFPAAGDLGSISNAVSPYGPWPAAITIVPGTGTVPPYASDVMWTFNGNVPISATSGPVDLGQFTVETAMSFPNPPYAAGALIDYSYNISGQTSSGSGFFAMSVPESSSLIMLLTGIGIVLLLPPIYRHRCRRRQSLFRAA